MATGHPDKNIGNPETDMTEEQAREEAHLNRMTPDTEGPKQTPGPRYHLHVGANGMHTVMRRVDKTCEDYDEQVPVAEYYDNVCICGTSYIALAVATALQSMYPDGNIT